MCITNSSTGCILFNICAIDYFDSFDKDFPYYSKDCCSSQSNDNFSFTKISRYSERQKFLDFSNYVVRKSKISINVHNHRLLNILYNKRYYVYI